MDSPNCSAPRTVDTPTQLQPNLTDAGISNLSMQNRPYVSTYTIQGPAPHGAAYYNPNAPPPSLPHNSGTPASSQQGAFPFATPSWVCCAPEFIPFSAGHGGQDIGAYLHIPCIKKLYEAQFGFLKTVTHLYEENRELRGYLERFKREMDQSPWLPEEPTN